MPWECQHHSCNTVPPRFWKSCLIPPRSHSSLIGHSVLFQEIWWWFPPAVGPRCHPEGLIGRKPWWGANHSSSSAAPVEFLFSSMWLIMPASCPTFRRITYYHLLISSLSCCILHGPFTKSCLTLFSEACGVNIYKYLIMYITMFSTDIVCK